MRVRTLAALMVPLLMAWPVAAQEQRGTIEGTIKNTSGAVLPGRDHRGAFGTTAPF